MYLVENKVVIMYDFVKFHSNQWGVHIAGSMLQLNKLYVVND